MEQSEITAWEMENQANIIRWEINYTNPSYDIITFEMKDKSIVEFKRIKHS